MSLRHIRVTEWWLAREQKKKQARERAKLSVRTRELDAGDIEVEAISGPMSGRKIVVSRYPAGAAYFKQ
jgi:hypothetical protein